MNEKRRIGGGGGASLLLLQPYCCTQPRTAPQQQPSRATLTAVWRSIADNFLIEFIASLFVHVSLALCWNAGDELRFAPAATLGLVMLCLKDEDLFFPDASPTVTFLLYALGGYNAPHLLARLMGQLCALGASIWFCSVAVLPPLAFRIEHPLTVVFGIEALSSLVEHLAIIYFVLPMLPPPQHSNNNAADTNDEVDENRHQQWLFFYRTRSKRDSTTPPPHAMMVRAALIVTALHYVLQRGLCAEVNPFATVMLAMAMQQQVPAEGGHGKDAWQHAGIAVWGQLVGVCIAAAYLVAFAPRLPRQLPPRLR